MAVASFGHPEHHWDAKEKPLNHGQTERTDSLRDKGKPASVYRGGDIMNEVLGHLCAYIYRLN